MEIRGHHLSIPVLQGGMGVGVSLGGLAGAVAACGGMGTISTADAGYQEPDFPTDPAGANPAGPAPGDRQSEGAGPGAGMVAVNAMVATRQFADAVRTAVAAGVDAVVCGAGPAPGAARADPGEDSHRPHRVQPPGSPAAP